MKANTVVASKIKEERLEDLEVNLYIKITGTIWDDRWDLRKLHHLKAQNKNKDLQKYYAKRTRFAGPLNQWTCFF